MSNELSGWYWVEWRNTLEPELFREGRIRDLDGDWIRPSSTLTIGPRIPTPEELKATELKLAKLQNLVDDIDETLAETREERDRLQSEVERLQPKEKSGWRFFLGGHGFRAVRHDKPGLYFDIEKKVVNEINAKTSDCLINNQLELTAAEAYSRLGDWYEGRAKFRDIVGYVPPETPPVQPEERVRCYRSNSGAVWVYGAQHDTYFAPYRGWTTAQSESTTLKNGTRCTLAEARALLGDKPASLAEFDRITGRDEDREHLARLMAIPCKEMRV